jgi:hypothetical protein
MALQKTIETNSGVEAQYHMVALTNVDWYAHRAHVEVLSFANQTTRQDGKAPLANRVYDWNDDNGTFDFDVELNIVEQTYTKLKTLPEWDGSIDV